MFRLITLGVALFTGLSYAARVSSSHLGTPIALLNNPELCLTFTPDRTYHASTASAAVYLVSCFAGTGYTSHSQLWHTPARDTPGAIRYLSSAGKMCLAPQSTGGGSKIGLQVCESIDMHKWKWTENGRIGIAEGSLCITANNTVSNMDIGGSDKGQGILHMEACNQEDSNQVFTVKPPSRPLH